jgi:pyruvate dehydrogenase E2 component (dihydrolipoamide acetyltransferase)
VSQDQIQALDYAERWLTDAFRVIEPAGGFTTVEVDMSRARALLDKLRATSPKATYNHLVVRAAAVALARRPDLHLLVAGTRRLRPSRVAIGLSVAGRTNFAPVMVIEDAGVKKLHTLVDEIVRRVPEVQAREEHDLAVMRRFGWLLPFAFLRRAVLRWLFRRLWFRTRLSGTFQITCVPGVDLAVPSLFNTAGCLGVGRVRDRVVAVDGAPAVRPTLLLACAIDHKAWDGVRVAAFQGELKKILEEGELEGEAEAE